MLSGCLLRIWWQRSGQCLFGGPAWAIKFHIRQYLVRVQCEKAPMSGSQYLCRAVYIMKCNTYFETLMITLEDVHFSESSSHLGHLVSQFRLLLFIHALVERSLLLQILSECLIKRQSRYIRFRILLKHRGEKGGTLVNHENRGKLMK